MTNVVDANVAKVAAEAVRKAVGDLNAALRQAAAANLHVEMNPHYLQIIGQAYGSQIWDVRIERREPI